jgi:hypothetical protein
MTELQQIELILGPEVSFWTDDAQDRFSLNAPNAMRIETYQIEAGHGWRVTHPNREPAECISLFASRRQAKNNLRLFLHETAVRLAGNALEVQI